MDPFGADVWRAAARRGGSIKALFVRQTGAGYLFVALAIVSVLVLAAEATTRLLEPARGMLGTVVSPVYLVAEAPYAIGRSLEDVFATRDGLLADNRRLERRVLELTQLSQHVRSLRAENERLRSLLGSRSRLRGDVLVSEIVAVVPRATTHQVVIDKGTSDGVRVGHAVIDAQGLFGQIVEVHAGTSRVLLISDASHAVPVRVVRNDVRAIAAGTGAVHELLLEAVPVSADVREGDALVSSGLGGRFPAGYPVGEVTATDNDTSGAFKRVSVVPSAELDRSGHVLVLLEDVGISEDVDDIGLPSDDALEGAADDGDLDADDAAGGGLETQAIESPQARQSPVETLGART